uniref:G-protein coupled receptors family 1 profile domain-containing protein n=1 Tax=Meloidogyne incognita TaxID=6306 RepID=A0A914MNI7_MELIC
MMTGLFTTNCFDNKSDPYFVLHEQEERNWIYIHFQGYPYLIIGLPGLFLTSLLSIALSLSIFQKQNKLKKRRRFGNKFYILLLNRTIGDLFACLTSLMISIYTIMFPENIDTKIMQLLNVCLIGCFWSTMITYVSISLLKLFGVAYPLKYRQKVSRKTCIRIVQINWVIILLMILLSYLIYLIVYIPSLSKWTGCRAETCLQFFVYQPRNFLISNTYLFTISCTLIAVIFIHHQNIKVELISTSKTISFKNSKICPSTNENISTKWNQLTNSLKNKQQSARRLPLAPLISGLFTFTIFHAPYALFAIYLTPIFTDLCFYLINYRFVQRYLGIVRCCVLLRICLDAILAFGTDKELSKIIKNFVGIVKEGEGEEEGGFDSSNRSRINTINSFVANINERKNIKNKEENK